MTVDCSGATHAIEPARPSLDEAFEDPALRERAPLPRIGGVCRVSRPAGCQGREPIARVIRDWCRGAGWTGAVWTDLLPNYAEVTGEAFTLARGADWLRRLKPESLDEAVRCIGNAPAATDTPLHRLLAAETWWRAQAARAAMAPARAETAGDIG